jgi:hypothetical protein
MTANAPQLWAQSGSSVNEEDSAWREVLRFQDDATSLLQKEGQDPKDFHMQRVQAFAMAESKVGEYTSKYATATDLKRLRLTYRMAVDLELAEKFPEALKALIECQIYLVYHDSKAIYDGRRIDVLVPERIKIMTALLSTPIVNAPGKPVSGEPVEYWPEKSYAKSHVIGIRPPDPYSDCTPSPSAKHRGISGGYVEIPIPEISGGYTENPSMGMNMEIPKRTTCVHVAGHDL